MKKIKNYFSGISKGMKFFLISSFMLLSCAVVSFAQDSTGTGNGGGPAVDPIVFYFGSIAALSLAILPVTGWIQAQVLKGKMNTQTLSWIVGILLGLVGKFFSLGMFAELGYLTAALNGLGSAIYSNGLADIPVIKSVLEIIGAKVPKTV